MSVVEQWAHGGLVECDLPSGLRVRGKLASVQDLILARIVPQELLAKAMALQGKAVEEFDEGERVTWIEWQRVQAAAFVREAWNADTEAWEPAVVTPTMLANGVPPEDVDALEDIVLRRRTPAQVTAGTRFLAGEIDEAELRRVMQEEAGGTVNAWSAFRRDAGGAAVRPDGPDVERPSVEPPRDQRPRPRPRSRRRDRRPPAG